MNEIWTKIKEYPDYMISNMGRVKSVKFGREKILKTGYSRGGYIAIVLCKNGIQKTHRVHRLVATHFIPNPNNLPQVNHKDENPCNNCVDNLEWGDAKYNCNYGNRTSKQSKALSIPIIQYDKKGNFIKKWESIREAGRKLGIFYQSINACLKGKVKTAGGFKWYYYEMNKVA